MTVYDFEHHYNNREFLEHLKTRTEYPYIGDNEELSQEEKECILYKNAEAFGFGKNHRK